MFQYCACLLQPHTVGFSASTRLGRVKVAAISCNASSLDPLLACALLFFAVLLTSYTKVSA